MDLKDIGGIVIGLVFVIVLSMRLPGLIAKWMGDEPDSESRKGRS